ncbi:polysaccharide biosynthesis/export family protein [Pseudomonas typographi]|uniref:Capsular biosynthesis protein n=1 Tax=Pseudomonas typographi TaxID=2715964 RepID=A0ABR7YVF3_9PSED|nr:polysaccharide biosynthesis/export family protein [Pseudomonas typographi]MBD1552162.1 capsular biosynthesis protein [Pseudomonas typographi]MBD1585134.1 capsular biosynthesis protein [Pseudomonas typographi]MBD1597181.1 capsular biosynthesis protein [Pseudomonas typographi]
MKCKVLVALMCSAILQGCAFAPGQHMTPGDVKDDAITDPVNVVQITSATAHQQQVIYSAPPVAPELLAYRPSDYRIGPGDGLIVTVWEHQELNSPAGQEQGNSSSRIVRNDGTLYYPYIESIKAGGKTVEQFRDDLQAALSKYLTVAKVDVNVEGYNSQRVILSGAFRTPGPQPLTNLPLSLVNAVSRAGGEADNANLAGLILRRDGHEYVLDVDTLNRPDSQLGGIYLKDGDQLHLGNNRANTIYVLGEVHSPQAMTYGTSTFNLMQALGNAGGIAQETAAAEAIYVIRSAQTGANQPATVFCLNAKKPTAFLLARQFDLQPYDVVFVGPANITRWNRFISQLLPSATVVGTTAAFRN